MARVPQFTRTVLMDRSNPGNIESAFAVGGGNEARALLQSSRQNEQNARAAGELSAQLAETKAAEARVNSQRKFNEFQRERITAQSETQLERQANPTGYAEQFDTWHNQKLSEFEASLNENGGEDSFDLDYYRQLMDRDRTSVLNENINWETGQRVKNTFTGTEQNIEGMNVNFMMSNPGWKDFVNYQGKMREYVNEVGGNILSPQDQVQLYKYGVDNAANAFFDQKLQDNPRAVQRVLEYGKGGQDAIIDFVMHDIEGGGRYVKDGGGYAKYGINSAANPDINVKDLTPEKAVEAYKTRYWDKRLDEYSPAFQAVAFDALVNHGNDKDTWKMIDAANQNPTALIGLRQKEYARLIAENPAKYKQNEAGWNRRLQTLNEFSNDMQGGGAEFIQKAALVDPKIIENVRKRIPQAIKDQDTAIEFQAKKAREADIGTKISNEDRLLNEVVYNEKLPLGDRIAEIRKYDLAGGVRDNFATEAVAYLNAKVEKRNNASPEKKLASFDNLTSKLSQIRIDLGGTAEKSGEVEINEKTLSAYQDFQLDVVKALNAGEITQAEARTFTSDFSQSILAAIDAEETEGGSMMPGVQDPYGYAFDYIDQTLKNTGQSKNLALKKELIMRFHEFSKGYESSLNTATDEQNLNTMLKQAMQSVNQKNFAGIIPPDKNPDGYVLPVPDVKAEHVFATVEEMEAAGLADGTPVVVAGQKGFARK